MAQEVRIPLVKRTGPLCAMALALLVSAPVDLASFELVVDGVLRIDTNRLPKDLSVSMWDTAAGDTQLTFWCYGEGNAASWSMVMGDVSQWQRTDKMEYLSHNFKGQEVFKDLVARLAQRPVSEGIVAYQWKSNQVEVRRPFVVVDLGGRRVSFLVDVVGDEVFSAQIAEQGLAIIEWIGQERSGAVDAIAAE